MKNTSHAVMAQRHEPLDSLDDFPTPPWATRAVIEHIILPALGTTDALKSLIVREPACNRGYMCRPLMEYFDNVVASDICDYGYKHQSETTDYLMFDHDDMAPAHWTFLNPPFKLAEQFIDKSFETPGWQGTAALVRGAFLEGIARYHLIFKRNRPDIVAQHTERVIMTRGKVRNPNKTYIDGAGNTRRPATATAYIWLIWMDQPPHRDGSTHLQWIPPCRRQLEQEGDYD